MADSVQLTDLDVIARYSIAVRSATADRDDLIAALRADLSWLERGRTRASTFRTAPAEADESDQSEEPPAPRRTAAKKTAARRTPRA
jgi:hypothetical protein